MASFVLPRKIPGKVSENCSTKTPHSVSHQATKTLAASITKAASRQTYYTVHFLVDRNRVEDAYRAYAYFRWVDDSLDQSSTSKREQMLFVEHQQLLVQRCYCGEPAVALNEQEQMLVELMTIDQESRSGLRAYIENMMAVMTFDARRRGNTVSAAELHGYSLNLATAVTEALHYFIGHDTPAPQMATRYLAATGAHIIHMLRDATDDAAIGYFNIPAEYLERNRLDPCDFEHEAYREWVRQRVELAKYCFHAGREYLVHVPSARCRLAALAYMARFSNVLRVIERDNYLLRPTYNDNTSWSALIRFGGLVLPYSVRPS